MVSRTVERESLLLNPPLAERRLLGTVRARAARGEQERLGTPDDGFSFSGGRAVSRPGKPSSPPLAHTRGLPNTPIIPWAMRGVEQGEP